MPDQDKVIKKVNRLLKRQGLQIRFNKGGVCNGLALLHIQYCLENKEEKFFSLLEQIEKKSIKALMSDGEVSQLIQGVLYYFKPGEFKRGLSQFDFPPQMKAEGKPIKVKNKWFLSASKQRWISLFQQLQKKARVLHIGSDDHAVSIRELADGRFSLYDPNFATPNLYTNQSDLLDGLIEALYWTQTKGYKEEAKPIPLSVTFCDTESKLSEDAFPLIEEVLEQVAQKDAWSQTNHTGADKTLFLSARADDVSAVEFLLNTHEYDSKALVDATHQSIKINRMGVADQIIRHGIQTKKLNNDNLLQILYGACIQGNTSHIEKTIQRIAQLEQANSQTQTAAPLSCIQMLGEDLLLRLTEYVIESNSVNALESWLEVITVATGESIEDWLAKATSKGPCFLEHATEHASVEMVHRLRELSPKSQAVSTEAQRTKLVAVALKNPKDSVRLIKYWGKPKVELRIEPEVILHHSTLEIQALLKVGATLPTPPNAVLLATTMTGNARLIEMVATCYLDMYQTSQQSDYCKELQAILDYISGKEKSFDKKTKWQLLTPMHYMVSLECEEIKDKEIKTFFKSKEMNTEAKIEVLEMAVRLGLEDKVSLIKEVCPTLSVPSSIIIACLKEGISSGDEPLLSCAVAAQSKAQLHETVLSLIKEDNMTPELLRLVIPHFEKSEKQALFDEALSSCAYHVFYHLLKYAKEVEPYTRDRLRPTVLCAEQDKGFNKPLKKVIKQSGIELKEKQLANHTRMFLQIAEGSTSILAKEIEQPAPK